MTRYRDHWGTAGLSSSRKFVEEFDVILPAASKADLESERIINPSEESMACESDMYMMKVSLIAKSSLVKLDAITPVLKMCVQVSCLPEKG
ncbi:hypothetical protein TNCV_4353831 [Trichonephila clavipes]|nr:hypothetical protein TNCV_4353831 [Trichonephila clavipes]